MLTSVYSELHEAPNYCQKDIVNDCHHTDGKPYRCRQSNGFCRSKPLLSWCKHNGMLDVLGARTR